MNNLQRNPLRGSRVAQPHSVQSPAVRRPRGHGTSAVETQRELDRRGRPELRSCGVGDTLRGVVLASGIRPEPQCCVHIVSPAENLATLDGASSLIRRIYFGHCVSRSSVIVETINRVCRHLHRDALCRRRPIAKLAGGYSTSPAPNHSALDGAREIIANCYCGHRRVRESTSWENAHCNIRAIVRSSSEDAVITPTVENSARGAGIRTLDCTGSLGTSINSDHIGVRPSR